MQSLENKLKRIQKGKTPNKLSSRDILNRLNSSRESDNTSISSYINSEPMPTVSTLTHHSLPTRNGSLFCCWRYRDTTVVAARYTSEVEVRDTVPLVQGDELLEND
ncbi:hypothetical protein LOD99_417 [Oopsacas minuta]|uniref:Uncharacterized protein n=1 Tax=Oopsacas minuta TaxID=111878 RepID=A0AAV7K933_9METZ|nr:hypothetical protein LOD99_417 [Oopsacas minuta]